MSEVKLGLGESPDPVFLFVGESIDEQGAVHPWHLYDHDAKMQIPVKQRALTGTITGLRMCIKTFKDKENVKLDINIMADKPYVVRSGIDTTFARGVLLGLETVDDFTDPLTLVVANGGEKVVFGRLHRANGERIKMAWDKERKLLPLVQKLQKRLFQEPQTWEQVKATATQGGTSPWREEEPPMPPPEDDLEDAPF